MTSFINAIRNNSNCASQRLFPVKQLTILQCMILSALCRMSVPASGIVGTAVERAELSGTKYEFSATTRTAARYYRAVLVLSGNADIVEMLCVSFFPRLELCFFNGAADCVDLIPSELAPLELIDYRYDLPPIHYTRFSYSHFNIGPARESYNWEDEQWFIFI